MLLQTKQVKSLIRRSRIGAALASAPSCLCALASAPQPHPSPHGSHARVTSVEPGQSPPGKGSRAAPPPSVRTGGIRSQHRKPSWGTGPEGTKRRRAKCLIRSKPPKQLGAGVCNFFLQMQTMSYEEEQEEMLESAGLEPEPSKEALAAMDSRGTCSEVPH